MHEEQLIKFRDGLQAVVNTLKNGSATHNFNQLGTTNLGLFCQFLFKKDENSFHNLLSRWVVRDAYYNDDYYYYNSFTQKQIEYHKENGAWWLTKIKEYYPLDGKPIDGRGLFGQLHKVGFTRDLLVAIESLNNEEVNEALKDYNWGTKTVTKYKTEIKTSLKPIMVTNIEEKLIPHTNWLKRLFGAKEKIEVKKTFFSGEHELVENEIQIPDGEEVIQLTKDYQNPDHVIVYYEKWIELLNKNLI